MSDLSQSDAAAAQAAAGRWPTSPYVGYAAHAPISC
jgi:hypothetical protein